MIASSAPMLIVLALGCLVLNLYAFRSDAAAAGHGPRQKLQMAAVWAAIVVGLTFLIRTFG